MRVAVGRLGRDILDREPRAAARLVLDHHRLAESLGELLADHARNHVGAAAGGIADDDPDELAGIVRSAVLGPRGRSRKRGQREAGAERTPDDGDVSP